MLYRHYNHKYKHNKTMQFTHKEIKIGMPETPYLLRVNKQVGCFAVGNIEAGNIESINTYGRGKYLEFAIAACDTDLHGKIGKIKEEQQYAFISAVVTASDSVKLPVGLLVHFVVYGYEARFFAMLAAESETASIFGDAMPQIIRMVFDRSVATQFGTNIKPPTISVRDAVGDELVLFEAAGMISAEYPTYLPDALALYPPTADAVSGEVVSGLNRSRDSSPMLNGASPLMLERYPEEINGKLLA